MRIISINFIGIEDWSQVAIDASEGAANPNATSPLKTIISDSNATPGQIKLPQYDQSTTEKILRYAAPNLTNDDYYPEKTVNSIIGSASNKTLGSFPLFSAAALAPAGLWDKRRRAIGDYMLELEKSKQVKDPGLNYEFKPSVGSNPLIKLNNDITIDNLENNYREAKQLGYSAKDIQMGGHPVNKKHNQTIAENTYSAAQINENDRLAEALHTDLKNLDNSVGSKAQEAASLWNRISTLPDDLPVDLPVGDGSMMHWDNKKQFFNSQTYKDIASHTGRVLRSSNDLLALADNRVKQIEKNTMEESGITSKNENYFTFLKKKISTKYPLVKDSQGNDVPDTEKFLDDIADQIISSRKGYFKSKDNPDGDYTKEELKDILSSNIGIERAKNDYVAGVPGAGGGSTTNTKNPAADYINTTLQNLSSGQQVFSGNNSASRGTTNTTFVIDGKTEVVANSDVVGLARATARMGHGNKEYGDIDPATVQYQTENGTESKTFFEGFNKSNNYSTTERYIPSNKDNIVTRFNKSVEHLSGEGGFPLATGDKTGASNIYVSGIKSRKNDGTDSEFFFNLKTKGDNTPVTGVVLPSDRIPTVIENPDVHWYNLFSDSKTKMFIDGKQGVAMLPGSYYKYVPQSKESVASYVVYDQKTNAPYEFPDESGTGTHTIKLPESYVKSLLSQPEKLLNEANKNAKVTTESSTTGVESTTQKLKSGGSGTVASVQKGESAVEPDDVTEERIRQEYIKAKYSEADAAKYAKQIRNDKKHRSRFDAYKKK